MNIVSVVSPATTPVKITIARLLLVMAGAAAMAWAAIAFPTFWSEKAIVDVAGAITRGEAFDPDVLAGVEAPTEGKASKLRSGILSKVAMIRLRQLENAIHAGDSRLIQQRLESTTRIVRETLRNAPDDPFVWLVLFSLDDLPQQGKSGKRTVSANVL